MARMHGEELLPEETTNRFPALVVPRQCLLKRLRGKSGLDFPCLSPASPCLKSRLEQRPIQRDQKVAAKPLWELGLHSSAGLVLHLRRSHHWMEKVPLWDWTVLVAKPLVYRLQWLVRPSAATAPQAQLLPSLVSAP